MIQLVFVLTFSCLLMSFFKLELKDAHRLTESEDLNQTEMLYVFLFQRGEEPQSEILDRGFRGGLGRDTLSCLCPST